MKLILDTNIIHGDFFLQGPRVSKLCSAAPKLGYELMIPEVVYDEMVDQYRRELEKHFASYERLVSLTNRARSGSVVKKLDKVSFLQERIIEYQTMFSTRLADLKIRVIPYPIVDIKSLVSKELLRKKPFKEVKEQGVGYRDALIWETVKSLCRPQEELIDECCQIEFVTDNTADFAYSDGDLHSTLAEELKAKGCLENCVKLISNVQEFFETQIDRELENLDGIKNALQDKGKFNRFNLEQELDSLLNKDFLEKEVFDSDFDSGEPLYLPRYYEEPSIFLIDNPVTQEVSVRRLEDESVLIEVAASIGLTLDFFVFIPDYYNYLENDKKVDVINWNWNEHFLLAERSVTVQTSLSFKTTPSLGKTLSSECRIVAVQF